MELLKKDTNFNFLAARRWTALASAALLVVSVVALVQQRLNFGIDFTGGTLVEVSYDEPVDLAQVRTVLDAAGYDRAIVQRFGAARDILVRLPLAEDGDAGAAVQSNALMRALRAPFAESLSPDSSGIRQQCLGAAGETADCRVQMRRVEFVGPQFGDELTELGSLAMLYALIGILVYVAWRFQWRFALGSVAALVHDVLIVVGFFSVFRIEFSLPVLAAVLAVIGYSLNDTIVVFDRIRENFRRMRKSPSVQVINVSINQTLRRTLLTSVTTLLVVLALLILGGEVIRGFALALLVGVLVGTYSSIFVASPIVLVLGISRGDLMPVKKEGEEQAPLP
ncbi:MAG: protein translocase subunit SecF [Gammaproteobacteria bacterium]|nr:protein translocase subunit SecF [Gammaproteobacteria bacterium]MDD9800861.1 protein translocase subunit SecF [Gammaproteobacteria bacterium]MDD9814844.1 protein translocase subunit SecF [Gammaproteobacteria bacterium]MDD9850755.1 protein translocase subunit SecF [Gammaproteobacteria bacterium]MDD9871407.1 protein translocase subunit SecF [Gammaproteobacteria bacterium]